MNDAKIIQAVGQMWQRIGVQTEVDPLPWTSYVAQANKQAFSAFLFGWGTGTAEASDPLIAQNRDVRSGEGLGRVQSRPLLQSGAGQADRAGDRHRGRCGAREDAAAGEEDWRSTMSAMIPLHIQKNIWATRAGLTYVPTVGEDLQLVNVRPAK